MKLLRYIIETLLILGMMAVFDTATLFFTAELFLIDHSLSLQKFLLVIVALAVINIFVFTVWHEEGHTVRAEIRAARAASRRPR